MGDVAMGDVGDDKMGPIGEDDVVVGDVAAAILYCLVLGQRVSSL